MLVVSRKKGTRIVAGDIEFSIVKISGNSVRVGIRAPEGVKVFRGELLGLDCESLEEGEPEEVVGDR
mgnify:FL=1